MSVLVSDRSESKFEAITYSIELHNMLIELMQRSFGVKDLDQFVRLRYAYGKDEQRRDYQNAAIVSCEQLINELQRVVEVFEVDVNVYGRYIKAIDREIGLIKKWRQRDNKIKSYLPG